MKSKKKSKSSWKELSDSEMTQSWTELEIDSEGSSREEEEGEKTEDEFKSEDSNTELGNSKTWSWN